MMSKSHERIIKQGPSLSKRVIYKHRKLIFSDTTITNHEPLSSKDYLLLSPSAIPYTADAATKVSLLYPNGSQEQFLLAIPKHSTEYNPCLDLVDTVKAITTHAYPPSLSEALFGTLKTGPLRQIIKAFNKRDAVGLTEAVDVFNKLMKTLPTSAVIPVPNNLEFCTHVLEQSYARIVSPVASSLIVKGFGNKVYGEIRPKLVDEFLSRVSLGPGMVFIDLGSGIGNVVLHVAAQCGSESFGCEIQERAAELGQKLSQEFINRTRCYNKNCGQVTLFHADFLESSQVDDVLRRADVVFVNNYVFDAELNQAILDKFLDLKDGAKVISLRSFAPKIGVRNSGSIGAIFADSQEYFFGRDRVSWTSEGGSFFVQTVDRAAMRNC